MLPDLFSFHNEIAPSGPGPPHGSGFVITFRHNTLSRTPLDEWSARRRDLYLTTPNIPKRQISMPPAGFEPAIPARDRPQNPRPLGSAVVSDSGRELRVYAGTEKESCVDWNIKATYGSVSYLARKLHHLLRCISKKRKISEQIKWHRRLSPLLFITKLSSILLRTDENHQDKPAD